MEDAITIIFSWNCIKTHSYFHNLEISDEKKNQSYEINLNPIA